jgi:nucleoside-diphosphate-sugar epimerase
MHAVLGADGQIGRLLVQELLTRDRAVAAISRGWSDQPFGSAVEYRVADVLNLEQLSQAIADCPTVYSVLGLPYVTAVWEQRWVPMTEQILRAVTRHQARLVFLDNVYAYGRVRGPMAEETPYRPVSRKGRVRAEAAQLLVQAMARGDARVIIARSADFIGPGAASSIVGARFFRGIVGSQSPHRRVEWLGDPGTLHCYNSTLSTARALAVLGQAEETAYGQTWHLPTYGPLTGYALCQALSTVCQCRISPRRVSTWLLRLAGLVNAAAREQVEMQYQVTTDYVFSDTKFRAAFPTFQQEPLPDLLSATVQYFANTRGGG